MELETTALWQTLPQLRAEVLPLSATPVPKAAHGLYCYLVRLGQVQFPRSVDVQSHLQIRLHLSRR